MNVFTRGIRNAFRNPTRTIAILVMLAVSTCLVLAMLVARSSINAKINEIKSVTATQITISPAGFRGGMGGGNALTLDQVKIISNTEHVSSASSSLTDQLSNNDTDLESSIELGNLGKRMQRFEASNSNRSQQSALPDNNKAMMPRLNITGTTDPSTTVSSDKITKGSTIDGLSSEYVALVGVKLAEKNELGLGDTFTAYGKKITVSGIFSTDDLFQDNGIIIPLKTLQTLTGQKDAVSSVIVNTDNTDNVAAVVVSLKKDLGDTIDVVSQQEQAESSLAPLKSISSLALAGVIGATVAGATIVLLSMIMIVRERRREIGIIKAIGGKDISVLIQFITEALTLTILGGIIGIGLGIIVSGPMTQSLVKNSEKTSVSQNETPSNRPSRQAIHNLGNQINNNLSNVKSSLTPTIFFVSIGITILIAVMGSAVPAWLIARIKPAEVLRTE